MQKIKYLSELIKEKNAIEDKIAEITRRPALIGHTGEYIASVIFDIRLEQSATSCGYDGKFTKGLLNGKTVNVKWYPKNQRILDIKPEYLPDYYLVLTGPDAPAESSRNKKRPWLICSVFLFKAQEIINKLKLRGVKIGVGTSVLNEYWNAAEIYPSFGNLDLYLSEAQRNLLKLFRD